MYYRRKILLYLINMFAEQGLSSLKLQKLLFLLCQKQAAPSFDFIPYKYGCYSFQAAKDLSVLETHYQLLKKEGDKWFLNQSFNDKLQTAEQQALDALLEDFVQKNDAQTVNHVYDSYPYYSIYSQWKMTAGQQQNKQREIEAIEAKNQKCLFTTGYEGKSIDFYLNQLVENNIGLLCDVRQNPISMKYGFSKSQLKKCCDNLHIIYEHIPELGIASQKRQNLNSKEDYQNLFRLYRQELPRKKNGAEQVLALLQKHTRIALTCFEKLPEECHRHCISDYLVENHSVECYHL